ncbi:hypothetical protein Nepgr_020559 [Nepenthes gracilis]|uniref:Guanylate kinase 1 n=1 Tax=Nepenthes gracilis TaxID=150966 RepID=A0AAD3XVB8_NEPGR|nr:hypothetical protein Nepgr_020559 [Nepenthes gracilis]
MDRLPNCVAIYPNDGNKWEIWCLPSRQEEIHSLTPQKARRFSGILEFNATLKENHRFATITALWSTFPPSFLALFFKFENPSLHFLAICFRVFCQLKREEGSMGEAPAICSDDLKKSCGNGFNLASRGSETAIVLGDRKYVIGGNDDESESSIGVKIYDKSADLRVKPTILGTKPTPSEDHWSLLLDENQDRILVIKNDSTLADRIWLLEVDTNFVRQQSKVLESDVVAWSKGVSGYPGKPVVFSGPSGVGKGTLISKLMKEFPSMFGFSVSHTTRAPREKEINGVHYHFTERTLMEKEIKEGKFLEFACVHGNLYGTSVEAVEVVADVGKRCILDIDVQGARSVRASSLEAIFIFVCPPSFEDLEKRLRGRGTETEEQIQKRLRNAKVELEQGRSSGLFDHILVNDDLNACYKTLKELLGLHEYAVDECPREEIHLSSIHSVSKVDHKIFINCSAADLENASKDSFVLDVCSLKGGAPGRTRGFNLYRTNKFADCVNEIKEQN